MFAARWRLRERLHLSFPTLTFTKTATNYYHCYYYDDYCCYAYYNMQSGYLDGWLRWLSGLG